VALRIFFCGTPEFAVPSLKALHQNPAIKIEGVITQPDRPRGRGQEISLSPVGRVATELGISVHQPVKIRAEESRALIEAAKLDALVIIAYGQIIPQKLIDLPRLGWINVHASLLPKYRGAAPIQWAIVNGEPRTGVTTMRIDAGLDTGPMLERVELDIGSDETAPELSSRLAEAGAGVIGGTLEKLASGAITPRAQDDSQASFAPILKKEDGLIDWNWSASQIYNRIRGLDPWPGTYSLFRGKQIQLWGRVGERGERGVPGTFEVSGGEVFVACGEASWLRLTEVKLEGRKRVTAREFANGARLTPGEKFGA
jgi:methionyl-tRNA formyltransferase